MAGNTVRMACRYLFNMPMARFARGSFTASHTAAHKRKEYKQKQPQAPHGKAQFFVRWAHAT